MNVLKKVKIIVRGRIVACLDRRHLRLLGVRDAKIIGMHPEWKELTEKEKELVVYKTDVNQLKAFKNVWGKLEYGFISDAAYQLRILPKLHKMDYYLNRERSGGNLFFDKNYFNMFLKEFKTPKVVMRSVEDEFLDADYKSHDDPMELLEGYGQLVFKKSLASGHGAGVSLVEKAGYGSAMEKYGEDYIVEEVVKQSPSFAEFNPSSVNVIRLTTLFWKGEVYILGGILRVGVPGEFCDHTTSAKGEHPRVIGLQDDGTLIPKVVDPDTATIYPDLWGKKVGGKIKKYGEMKEIAKREHLRFPHHKIIGWDLTLDEIEYNGYTPGVIQSQYVLGPIFAQKSSRGIPLLDELMNA